MVKYHPDTRYLTDFASGSLSRSLALCVSAHLHYCAQCRRAVGDLTTLGTALFERLEPHEVSTAEFDRLMTRIDTSAQPRSDPRPASTSLHVKRSPPRQRLPQAIQRLTGDDPERLRWNQLGSSFRYYPLDVGEDGRRTSLFAIRRGGKMPGHRHKGDEVTVVLRGSFSDQEDHYHQGDFIVRGSGEKHRPVAAQHDDCLCLASLESPIAVTSWWYRLLQPLTRLRTAAM